MKLLIIILLAMIFSVVLSDNAKGASMAATLQKSRQIIIVKAKSRASTAAEMSLYERTGEQWCAVKQGIPVVLGKNGLGWGRSFGIDYKKLDKNVPAKMEGDGRSPSGIFGIQRAFGFSDKNPSIRLPYVKLTASVECVDDAGSKYYNQVIDNREMPSRDWKSSERMSAVNVYKIGLVIEHNTQPVVKGRGSCIFFHIWDKPDKGTSGCTAMAENDLAFLVQWLDPEKDPLLLQFTEEIYNNIKGTLNLP